MNRWFASLFVLSIAACGGGSSSTSDPVPVLPPAPRTDLLFGYFGTADGQVAATADSVNVVHAVDWGDWDADQLAIEYRIIDQMQQARARGVTKVILSTGFLTFNKRYLFLDTVRLAAFKVRLDGLDLSRMVVALYPIDEPDVKKVPDAMMVKAYDATRAAWPGVKIAVVYGMTGDTPGISAADWVGRDDYRVGVTVFSELPPLRTDQEYIIPVGGANPYRQDPVPFQSYANAHANVALLWAFLFTDYVDPDGVAQLGIGKNGMLPAYAAVGAQIKGSSS